MPTCSLEIKGNRNIEIHRLEWNCLRQNTPSVGGPHPGGPTGTLTTITYQTPKDGTLTSYSQWVQDIAARYGHRYGDNSPDRTILAWELVNEPREDPTVLSHFFKDTISVMKAKEPLTPISLGAIDNGEQGFRGADIKMQNAIDGVVYVTALAMFSQFEQHDAAVCGPSKYTSRLSYHSPYVGWEADLLSEEVPPRTATPK